MSRQSLRPKSRLEDLPAEIIQEIFFQCLEINLPRASAAIASALSNVTIYMWLVQLAFSAAEGRGDILTQGFLPGRHVFDCMRSAEIGQLRTRILECRWCTLPLIRSCQLVFLNHVFKCLGPELVIVPDDQHHLAGFTGWFDNLGPCNKEYYNRRDDSDLLLRANRQGHGSKGSESESSHDYDVAVWFNFGTIQISSARNKTFSGQSLFQLPFCHKTYVPDKLLHPPWTEEKLDFLQVLSPGAILDEDIDVPRATHTLRDLIQTRDFVTFTRLLRMSVRMDRYAGTSCWPTRNIIFWSALKHSSGKDDPFIRLLVEERWEHIESGDIRLKEKLLKNYSVGTVNESQNS